MEQGFAPTLEDNGFNVLQVRKDFFEILKRHVLELPIGIFRADAHLAQERTAGGQFDLPCREGSSFAFLQKPAEQFFYHGFNHLIVRGEASPEVLFLADGTGKSHGGERLRLPTSL